MQNETKTHADILAEYRHDCDQMDAGYLYQPTSKYLRILLDRIEAAHRRESGNAAAMREALELAVYYSEYIVDHLPDEFVGEIHAASEILEKCDAALASPARNCDRFATADEARKAWEAETRGQHWAVELREVAYPEWLFMTAREGAE